MSATYPNAPGFKTDGPSQEAAESETGRSALLRKRILDLLRGTELTADECATQLQETVLAVRPRFSELLKQGKIEDTELRRRNASGKSATVWRAVVAVKQREFAL